MDYKLPCVRIWHQCIVISSRSVDGQSRHTHTHRVTFYQLTAFSTFSNLWLWFPFVPTFIFIQNSTYLTKETKTKHSSVLFSFFFKSSRTGNIFFCLFGFIRGGDKPPKGWGRRSGWKRGWPEPGRGKRRRWTARQPKKTIPADSVRRRNDANSPNVDRMGRNTIPATSLKLEWKKKWKRLDQ